MNKFYKTAIAIMFATTVSAHEIPERITSKIPEANWNMVPCDIKGCQKRYGGTEAIHYPAGSQDLIIWMNGGPGQNSGHITYSTVTDFVGHVDIVGTSQSYAIKTGGSHSGKWSQINGNEQAARIRSVVLYFKRQFPDKRIWLGGHSTGAARVAGFLQGGKRKLYQDNQKLIHGAIFSGTNHAGAGTDFGISVRYELDMPVLIIHHDRDHCKSSHVRVSRIFYDKVSKRNRGVTEHITITTGNPNRTRTCGFTDNHAYIGSRIDHVNAIHSFMKRNTPQQ